MNSRLPRILVFAAAALLAQVAVAGDILWDQTTLDYAGPGIANSDSPGFGGFTIHGVNDVTVDGCGWIIESITQYYSTWNMDWPSAVTQGYLHVFPKTGPLPTDDPTASPVVPMTCVQAHPDYLAITASGLNIALDPGEYWIGITPMGPAGMFGANLQWPTAVMGVDVASYDVAFPAWTNMYAGYDGTLLIEGVDGGPSANEVASWGLIKSLYR